MSDPARAGLFLLPATPAPPRLGRISNKQIERSGWPDFDSFKAERYPEAMRRRVAHQWWRRAREEYGSIHEFTALSHALTETRAPIDLLGSLARLITDEVRHAKLAAQMAAALLSGLPEVDPSGKRHAAFDWSPPAAPFAPPPRLKKDQSGEPQIEPLLAWAADVLICSCCIGETLSLPLYQTLITLITDPVPRSVVQQILRDEHLHSVFGWEALAVILPSLGEASREWLQKRLSKRLAGFEVSCSAGISLEELAGTEILVEPPGPNAPPNLGIMDRRVYAMVFYSTIESEILPGFEALGFDAKKAWAERALHTRVPGTPPSVSGAQAEKALR